MAGAQEGGGESKGGMQIEAYMGLDKLIQQADTRDKLLTGYLLEDLNTLHGATGPWQAYTLPTGESKEQDLIDTLNVWTLDAASIALGLPFQQWLFGFLSGIFGRSRRVEQSFVDKMKYVQESSQRVAGVAIEEAKAKWAPRHANPKFIYRGKNGKEIGSVEFDGADAEKITTFPPFPEYLKADGDGCEQFDEKTKEYIRDILDKGKKFAKDYGIEFKEPAEDEGEDYASCVDGCPLVKGLTKRVEYLEFEAADQKYAKA